MKDFITLKEISKEDLYEIIEFGIKLKQNPEKFRNILSGKTLALIFQKTSTRTRVSFEAGMIQLGGHAIFLDWKNTNFLLGEIEDEVRCLSRYVDAIMARVFEHSDIERIRDAASVPVINGLSDSFHPCQTIADLQLIYERFNDPTEITVAFVGDGSNNVASSLIIGCAKLGIHINIGAPRRFTVRDDVIKYLKEQQLSSYLSIYENPLQAVKNADVIYTDTFVSMGQEEESSYRLKIFEDYRVTTSLVKASEKEPLIMHCLPAHRDVEIESAVLDSKNSVVFDQAENRLHAQKALLLILLAKDEIKNID